MRMKSMRPTGRSVSNPPYLRSAGLTLMQPLSLALPRLLIVPHN